MVVVKRLVKNVHETQGRSPNSTVIVVCHFGIKKASFSMSGECGIQIIEIELKNLWPSTQYALVMLFDWLLIWYDDCKKSILCMWKSQSSPLFKTWLTDLSMWKDFDTVYVEI